MSRLFQSGLFLLTLLLVLNVTIINIAIVHYRPKSEAFATAVMDQEREPVCDSLCQQNIVRLMQNTVSPSPQSAVSPARSPLRGTDVYPLGSGSVTSKDWTSVPGVEIEIDTTRYDVIEKVMFETYMSIPQAVGYAYVKLFNATDKHDVWYSELSMETDAVIRKTADINLIPGKKKYQVMMKSTLGAQANLHNARIVIHFQTKQ